MLDEAELLQAFRRHWEYSGEDEDLATGSTTTTLCSRSPSPANGSKVCRTSGNGAGSSP